MFCPQIIRTSNIYNPSFVKTRNELRANNSYDKKNIFFNQKGFLQFFLSIVFLRIMASSVKSQTFMKFNGLFDLK